MLMKVLVETIEVMGGVTEQRVWGAAAGTNPTTLKDEVNALAEKWKTKVETTGRPAASGNSDYVIGRDLSLQGGNRVLWDSGMVRSLHYRLYDAGATSEATRRTTYLRLEVLQVSFQAWDSFEKVGALLAKEEEGV